MFMLNKSILWLSNKESQNLLINGRIKVGSTKPCFTIEINFRRQSLDPQCKKRKFEGLNGPLTIVIA